MKLFLGGDLMLARGIDQILPHPVDPVLYEPWIHDARDYVRLAERHSGPVPRLVEPRYVWGDALEVLDDEAPDVRIVNLETSITDRGEPDAFKDIHYRMSPRHTGVLLAARIDVCTLANNHVLDWGPVGLQDTLATLEGAGILHPGAGSDLDGALAPAVVRGVAVTSVATGSSGVRSGWAATASRAGVARLPDLSLQTADAVAARATEDPNTLAVVSIHWGGNWGYGVSDDEIAFAHRLIEQGVDVVHGHSSHHPRRVEIYRDRPILYGCGELLDDYEGITGYESFRSDLVLLWFVDLDAPSVYGVPMRIRRLRLERASDEEVAWLARTHDLRREDGRLIV